MEDGREGPCDGEDAPEGVLLVGRDSDCAVESSWLYLIWDLYPAKKRAKRGCNPLFFGLQKDAAKRLRCHEKYGFLP